MSTPEKMNGHQHDNIPVPDMVGITITPIGPDVDHCNGAIVRLSCEQMSGVQQHPETGEVYLAAGMSGPQCREIARQLLTIADAASNGREITMLCVTQASMWKLPGQALIATRHPMPHFEFAVQPQSNSNLVKPSPRKLIIP